MTFSNLCNDIFWKSTTDYHVTDSVDAPMNNPYELKSIEYYLYLKNWIDAVQWHFEDIIRDPHIDPVAAVALKRRIDKSNTTTPPRPRVLLKRRPTSVPIKVQSST